MSTQRAKAPGPKVVAGIEEIKSLILSRCPHAAFEVRPSWERREWDIVVYLDNEDENYEDFAGLVYPRVADLRYDRGIAINVMSADRSHLLARQQSQQVSYALHEADDKTRYRTRSRKADG